MSSVTSHSTTARFPAASETAESFPQARRPIRRWSAILGNGLSTALVIAGLGGMAAWGHFSDWSVPKFSALWGASQQPAQLWCAEHNVAESQCIECQAGLVPKVTDHGWCRTHGIAQCPFENPDVVQRADPYEPSPGAAERAVEILALRPRGENAPGCNLYKRRIQFASESSLEKAGVDVELVVQQTVTESIAAPGEIDYDPNQSAHLASRGSGTVNRVFVQLGDRVRAGDLLALIDSAEVGRAKSDLLTACAEVSLQRATVQRLTPLARDGTLPVRQMREAEAQLRAAEVRLLGAGQSLVNLGLNIDTEPLAELPSAELAQRVRTLGLPDDLTSGKPTAAETSNLLPLRSPLDGEIVSLDLVAGEVVTAGLNVLTVANVDRMWLLLDVKQEDAPYVQVGQTVRFRPAERSSVQDITGTVAWLSTSADERTRTVKVRVELPKVKGGLRANTFGQGWIVMREEPAAVVISDEALHWDGNCHIVFVRDKKWFQPGAAKYFHVREVRPGVASDAKTEIIAGLAPGEVIASRQSVVLESQLLKSNLGAGCGCVD